MLVLKGPCRTKLARPRGPRRRAQQREHPEPKAMAQVGADKPKPVPLTSSSQPPPLWADNYPGDGTMDPHVECV